MNEIELQFDNRVSKFSENFSTWNKKKLRYYYESAVSYSKEGNRYVNWAAAISNWATRDELAGKLKFDDNASVKGSVIYNNK